ncbi:MAG: hypothetical protein Alis3KO_09290 [Aliiglaciecola sp.]
MLKKALTGIFALTLASYANASTTTFTTQNWDFSSNSVNVTGGSSDSQINMSAGGVNVKVTAWSSTGNGACGTGAECGTNDLRDDDPFIERARLTQYDGSGLGAINNDEGNNSPNHALDNQRYFTSGMSSAQKEALKNELDFDMVLFEFDQAVELTAVKSGWTNTDSDLSILGYTGGGSLGSTPFSSNTKWSDLISQGWGFNTDTFDNGTSTQAISSSLESRYWLVGVYNPVFNGTNFTHHNDAVKLMSISTKLTERTEVPEPATFALLLAGVAAVFRRRTKA